MDPISPTPNNDNAFIGVTNDLNPRLSSKKHLRRILLAVLIPVILIAILAGFFSLPPRPFPGKTVVSISDGYTLTKTADLLKADGLIKSPFLFKTFVVLFGGDTRIIKGDYLFDNSQSVLRIAYRISNGIIGQARLKVTIPEGSNVGDIAMIIKKSIPSFDDVGLKSYAKIYEGKLFPDTYYFYENIKPTEVVKAMNDVYNRRIGSIQDQISGFNKSTDDVVKMASIVEKEATSSVDRRIIAGILWKRINDGMPLQVDPPFFYFLNKTSSQLTIADLAVDSPYNLYKNKGLPPTAIDNPGLEAITDTINPTTTKYWYYLSDKNGSMHYATTYDGHLANKAKYIQ
jgi:UPF0755 protein